MVIMQSNVSTSPLSLSVPDPVEKPRPDLASWWRIFLPLLGERAGVRAGISVHLPSSSRPLSLPSPPPKAGERVAEGRERGLGSWSQCIRKNERGLSMSRPIQGAESGVLRLFVSKFAIVLVPWLAIQVACATSPVADQTAPRSGVPNKRVVVRFADLARRQAEQPDTNRVARSVHAPMPKSRPWTNTLSAPIRKAGPPPSGPGPRPAASGSAPPELGGSFPAIIDDQRVIPPDTMGAVGPGHVMTTLNSEVAVQTRQGDVVSK